MQQIRLACRLCDRDVDAEGALQTRHRWQEQVHGKHAGARENRERKNRSNRIHGHRLHRQRSPTTGRNRPDADVRNAELGPDSVEVKKWLLAET